jgi:hypothetical protein
MGLGQIGGDGSVAWKIDVDDGTKPGKKRVSAFGRDDANPSTFAISLEYANADAAQKDLTRLIGTGGTGATMRVNGNKIEFTLTVQLNNEDQISIEW